jgi:hypothetical protein
MGHDAAGVPTERPFLYDARHLCTHGVIIGMTGSGKTGLSVALLEEAAIDGVPAIVIDPKGDLANLLLTFPELSAEAFAPWVAEGKDAAAEADLWRRGITDWGQDASRIARLREAADYRIYTPGSTAGTPISIVRSLELPPETTRDDAEALRERVMAVASSLLGLLGIDADPVKSREHVLLSNILAHAWQSGEGLELGTLIARIQRPLQRKVGVLDMDAFYPEKDRAELAGLFNNLLASPAFAAWLEGDALDVAQLLRSPAGKPRISIFSIAHLSDGERMFFVTLLLHQMVSWMRAQSGTQSLRALLYMDEIFGFFPPVANPPSKLPLLTLLKQARAFGLGVLLATQNPVDLDYKGLANTGTWFIGRLQTDRDKARVVEGLAGAGTGGAIDRPALERLLSSLEKRQFLLHDVHEPNGPYLLRTRFTLSYLRGPLTREQLRKLRPAAAPDALPARGGAAPSAESASAAPSTTGGEPLPMLPSEVVQLFVGDGPAFTPSYFGAATVHVQDAKAGVDISRAVGFSVPLREGPLPLDWENATWFGEDAAKLPHTPPPGARTTMSLPVALTKTKTFGAIAKEFATWLVQNQGVSRLRSPTTGLLSSPNEDEAAFRARVAQAMRELRDATSDKLRGKYAPKFEKLRVKIETESALAEQARREAEAENQHAMVGAGADVLSAIFGRGSAGSKVARGVKAASRARGKAAQKAVSHERRLANVSALQDEWRALDETYRAELAESTSTFDPQEVFEVVAYKPKKAGVQVVLSAILWRS